MSAAEDEAEADPEGRARAVADAMMLRDRAARSVGMSVEEVGPGYATTVMTVTEAMVNGVGILHGALTFMLADQAFAIASNSHGIPTVTRTSDIEYLRPAQIGERLRAVATERRHSPRGGGVYDVAVLAENGELVAEFRGHSSPFRGGQGP